jgi:uncharacterized protein (TIGR02679 family)
VGLVAELPEDLGPLWRAVHERLSSGRAVSRVRVGPLSNEQRSALADLLGLARLPGEYVTVSLLDLDEVLAESVGCGAREVVSRLIGPVGDRAADRERDDAARHELWAWLLGHAVVVAQPALISWADAIRRSGLIGGSVTSTREVLADALSVIAELPAAGEPLPVLAERVLGDTHKLDDGTRCSGLVLRALAAIFDVDPPANAQERRALWDRAGIADDDLSSVVLAAGIWATGPDIASRLLRACADAGHAAVLTLGHIRSSDLAGGLPAEAWVFENPSVLALALARFGRQCPPVVITAGWPNSAAIALLGKLTAAGTVLRYHGDFDGEGLRIAAAIAARTGAIPWRMTSADYLTAVGQGPSVGRVTEAPWDADLAGHLSRVGVTVSEERVAARLLDELSLPDELSAAE